jgi:hypothetical protein
MKSIGQAVKDFAGRLAGAKTALGELHDLDRELRAQHAAAVQARNIIGAAPPPLDEILANVERVISSHAAQEVESLARQFRQYFGGELIPKTNGSFMERKPSLPDWFHSPDLTLARLCALFPEQAKTAIAAILRSVPFEAGSSMTDRLHLIAEADARIHEAEAQHEQLAAEAAALEPPVMLTLLPAVKARREAAAAKAQREGATDEARRRAEAAVNAQNPAPSAAGSLYLRAGGGRLQVPGE